MIQWDEFLKFMTATMLMNNIMLMLFCLVFGAAFLYESMNPKSSIHWTDMIVDPKTKQVSLAKIGQFLGLAVSTWVIITLSQSKEALTIFPMIFPMWLAFIGGSWSYDKYIKSKQSGEGEHKRNDDPKDDAK